MAKNLTGFTAVTPIEQATIKADGSTVVKIYYTRNSYTLAWNLDGGRIATGAVAGDDYTAAGLVRYGTVIAAPEVVRTGYQFSSWTPEVPFSMPAENVTYKAVWAPNIYYVTFDANGGEGTMADQEFRYDEKKALSKLNFSREGYTFKGWALDGVTSFPYDDEEEVENLTTINGNKVKMSAIWEAIVYKITVEEFGHADKETANLGDVINLTYDERAGYTFKEWIVADANENAISTSSNTFVMPASDVNVKPIYTANLYNITVEGGSADKMQAIIGDIITLTNDEREGYNFIGWDVEDANGNAITVANAKFTMPAANVVVRAKFDNINYLITVENGTADKATATLGETVEITANEPAAGYEFDQWTIISQPGPQLTDSYAPNTTLIVGANNVTIRADYKLIDYKITVINGSADVNVANYNQQVSITADEPEVGYKFTGWTIESGEGATIQTDILSATTLTVGTSDVTVKANYELAEYIITVEGGSANPDKAVKDTQIQLTPDEKVGYTFDGWSAEPDVQISFEGRFMMPASDVNISANFTANRYAITYVANGGVGNPVNHDGLIYDENITLYTNDDTEFTNPGYQFVSWNTAADGTGTTFAAGSVVKNLATSGTVTLYAQWEIAGYFITFDSNGGSGSMERQQINYNVEDELHANEFERTGYNFVGWNIEADGTGTGYDDRQLVKNVTTGEAVTLFAQWRPVNYEIAFIKNAESVDGEMVNQSFVYDIADRLNTNRYQRAGYTFDSWNLNAEGTSVKYQDADMVSNVTFINDAVVDLYAQWTANTYSIVFKANDGTGRMDDEIMYYDQKKPISKNEFTREGYQFSHWGTTADDAGLQFVDREEVVNLVPENNGTINLFAQWQPNEFTIVYKANNAAAKGEMAPQTFTFDKLQALAENAFTVDGYVFRGWATSADGEPVYADGEQVSNLTNVPNATIELYAVWSAHTYYVAFDGNGSTSGAMSKQVFDFDEARYLDKNNYQRLGYSFAGWSNTPDGIVEYVDGAVVTNLTYEPDATITLYAQWTIGIFSITTDLYTVSSEIKAPMGTVIKLTPLGQNGYAWTGWDSEPYVIIEKDSSFVMPAYDVNIKTLFEVDYYDIHYTLDGGNNNPENVTTYTILSDDIKLYDPTRAGYIFQGWYRDNGELTSVIPAGSMGDITLTAKWRPDLDIDGVPITEFIKVNFNFDDMFVTCENEEEIIAGRNPDLKDYYKNSRGNNLRSDSIMQYVEYKWIVNGAELLKSNSNKFRLPNDVKSRGTVDVEVSLIDQKRTYHFDYEIRRRFIAVMWNDVITIINNGNNTDGNIFSDTKITWYHNDLVVNDQQSDDGIYHNYYYCEQNGLTGFYYAVATADNGEVYKSCVKDCSTLTASSLVVYPNPAEGQVNVEGGTWEVGDEITVVNSFGQTVIRQTTATATRDKIDLSGLPQGTYIVRIGNDAVTIVKR